MNWLYMKLIFRKISQIGNFTGIYGMPNRTLMPIFWYQKMIFYIRNSIFWYQKLFSDIRKSEFLISENTWISDMRKWFSDIRNWFLIWENDFLISEICADFLISELDFLISENHFLIWFSDIRKSYEFLISENKLEFLISENNLWYQKF